jgi:3-methyladenine DNA glycosylase AlkC
MPRDAALSAQICALRTQADSNDWQEREEAGFTLRNLIEQQFQEGMELTGDWVSDPSERVRRAACLACMQRKARTTPERLPVILGRLEPLMADDSLYVRKCCGPFVVGYLGYTYPRQVLPWLWEQAASDDLNVRANVAKAFSQALGSHHPDEAVQILSLLAPDERHRVRSAVLGSLRNLLRRRAVPAADLEQRFFDLAAQLGRR